MAGLGGQLSCPGRAASSLPLRRRREQGLCIRQVLWEWVQGLLGTLACSTFSGTPGEGDPAPSTGTTGGQRSRRPDFLPGLESGITRGKWRRDGLSGLQRDLPWLKHSQGPLDSANLTYVLVPPFPATCTPHSLGPQEAEGGPPCATQEPGVAQGAPTSGRPCRGVGRGAAGSARRLQIQSAGS